MIRELPPTSMEALREELARVRAQLAEYVGYEPTIREEMNHLREVNERLEAIIGHLLTNELDTTTRAMWTSDLDALMGGVLWADDDHVSGRTHLRFVVPGASRRGATPS